MILLNKTIQKISGIFCTSEGYFFINFVNTYLLISHNRDVKWNNEQEEHLKIIKMLPRILLSLLTISVVIFVCWGCSPMSPAENALTAVESTQSVKVTKQNGWLVFEPPEPTPQVGLIFYPGGHVDYRAYARPLSQIAEAGFLVVVVRMPFNLALFGTNRADEVIASFPQIRTWVIGGHSLGGAMASYFTDKHTELVDGLVLWGAYPPQSVDLSSEKTFPTMVIYGELDKVASPDEILATKTQFPPGADFIVIEGGNHSQFGDYGLQRGDQLATIPTEAQQQAAVTATISLLDVLQNQRTKP